MRAALLAGMTTKTFFPANNFFPSVVLSVVYCNDNLDIYLYQRYREIAALAGSGPGGAKDVQRKLPSPNLSPIKRNLSS